MKIAQKVVRQVVRQVLAAKKARRKPVPPVKRLAISLDPKLAKEVQRAAKRTKEGNVSAWLAEAAQEHLRHDALSDVIRMMEETNGPSTKEALDKIEREWLG